MLVPSFLFGEAREVRANVGRAVTRLRRGATIQDICESSGKVDLADYPKSFVWIERAWVMRPSNERDYRAVAFTDALFDPERIPFEQSNSIREASVEYLSSSPWGTALLNSGQGGYWHTALPLRPLRPSRRGYIATLTGTLRHWEALTAIGSRYYSGGFEATTFAGTLPAYGGILARLGIDPRAEGTSLKDIRLLCGDGTLIGRLTSDDLFWNNLVRKWRSDAGTPDLNEENLEEIKGLCEAGSWDKAQWEYLRRQCGTAAVEQALERVALAGDPSKLLGVYIHALGDMEPATLLFSKHEAVTPDVHWADVLIARHLKTRDPKRSASILFQAAERAVPLGRKVAYRRIGAILVEARDLLLEANLEFVWKEQLDGFIRTHTRRKALIASLTQALSRPPSCRGESAG